MADNEDDWIRKRAYSLWEEEGRPSGKDAEHWERAKKEFAAFGSAPPKRASARQTPSTSKTTSSGSPVTKPAAKRTKKPAAPS